MKEQPLSKPPANVGACPHCPTPEQPVYFDHDCPAERERRANEARSSNEKVRFIRTALIEAHATIVRARGSKLLLKDINDALGMLDGDGVSLEPPGVVGWEDTKTGETGTLCTVCGHDSSAEPPRECRHPVLTDDPEQPGVNIYLCAACKKVVRVNEFESFVREPEPSDAHAFKNFHRVLCERFGYAHDERDWRRDQISLIEHIASRLAQPPAAEQSRMTADQVSSAAGREPRDEAGDAQISSSIQPPADGYRMDAQTLEVMVMASNAVHDIANGIQRASGWKLGFTDVQAAFIELLKPYQSHSPKKTAHPAVEQSAANSEQSVSRKAAQSGTAAGLPDEPPAAQLDAEAERWFKRYEIAQELLEKVVKERNDLRREAEDRSQYVSHLEKRLAEPPNDPRPAEYAALIRAFADWWLGHHDDSRFFNEAMQASPVLAVGMGDTLRQALTKTVRIEPNPLRDWEVPDEKSARCMAAVADAKCVREAGHSGDHYWGPASHPDNCQCNTCYTRKTVAAVETDAPLLCGCDDVCIGPDNVGVAQCRAENDEL